MAANVGMAATRVTDAGGKSGTGSDFNGMYHVVGDEGGGVAATGCASFKVETWELSEVVEAETKFLKEKHYYKGKLERQSRSSH